MCAPPRTRRRIGLSPHWLVEPLTQSGQKNCSTPEKECLAIVWAILKLLLYLEGTRFTEMDYDSLLWLLNMIDASSWVAR